jgi:hypothetical protein
MENNVRYEDMSTYELNKYLATIQKVCDEKDSEFLYKSENPELNRKRGLYKFFHRFLPCTFRTNYLK